MHTQVLKGKKIFRSKYDQISKIFTKNRRKSIQNKFFSRSWQQFHKMSNINNYRYYIGLGFPVFSGEFHAYIYVFFYLINWFSNRLFGYSKPGREIQIKKIRHDSNFYNKKITIMELSVLAFHIFLLDIPRCPLWVSVIFSNHSASNPFGGNI